MKAKQLNRPQRGVTLIELLVVLVILGLLAGVVGPSIWDKFVKAKRDTAALQIQEFGPSLDMFKLEVGRYPTSQEGLQALMVAPPGVPGWSGPYLRKPTLPKDPWGFDYHYVSPSQHGLGYDISSYGPDNAEGGDGDNKDINSWEK